MARLGRNAPRKIRRTAGRGGATRLDLCPGIWGEAMADGFETLVDDAQAFFSELRDNNEKSWFEPRKTHYNDAIRRPADLLADLVAEDLSRLTGQSQTPKVFRIYRDVRFSKDKTPYKTNLFLLWSSSPETAPAWFFAIRPDALWFGFGLLGLSGDMLTRYRQCVDRHGAEVSDMLHQFAVRYGTALSNYGPDPLKRVPKPFAADHPQADLLRRKGLAIGANLPDTWRARGLVATLKDQADGYLPLWSLIHEKL